MKNIELLDCTLRDGGYHNDWAFGNGTLISVFERVVNSGVEFLELGFLDERRFFDLNRSIVPNTQGMRNIFGGLDRKKTKLVGMIDFGTCSLENIEPASESFLDGIRVIFKKHVRKPAMEFCRELKNRGYLVFSQLVSITSYTDCELMDLIELVNDVRPYAVSIVDTYGLLHKNNLLHYYEILDRGVNEDVAIGYHSHNNFQLAYANCIELIEHHRGKLRRLLCDASLYGMGKGAGNAPTELLCMYLNDRYNAKYNLNQLLEAIDCSIVELHNKYRWGYSMKSFIAASNDCHPNYVSYLLDKKTLSVKSVNEILSHLSEDKRLLYDRSYIEELYIDYQRKFCSDACVYRELANLLSNCPILILGPGRNLKRQKDRVLAYISKVKPYIISINCIPDDIPIDALFITNSKRYQQQIASIKKRAGTLHLIATSNLTRIDGSFDYTLDYESLIDRNAVFMDNSFIMMLKVLMRSEVREAALAGFDGYSSADENYYCSQMEYDFLKRLGQEVNNYVSYFLRTLAGRFLVKFITDTLYEHD